MSEPRLIDANELRKESKMLYSIHAFEPVEAYTQDQIDAAPTIDAVPVVRCGECRFYEVLHTGCCKCPKTCKIEFPTRNSDDFCSYGTAREPNA